MISFIDAYFGEANFVATKAMELSAYKFSTRASLEQTAAELMNHPLVIAEVKRRQELRSDKAEVKAEWLITKLQEIALNTQESNPQAAIRAIELLGKTIAIWRDRQEISGPDGEAIQTEQRVKESVAEFTDRLNTLTERQSESSGNPRGSTTGGTGNITQFPRREGTGTT